MTRSVRILRAIVIATAVAGFLAPLFWSSFTLYPFVWGKALWLHLVVTVGAPALVALWVLDPASRPARSRPHVWLAASAVVLLLATVFAVDPHQSFWGRDERLFGTLAWMYFGLWYLMLVAAFQVMRTPRRLLQAAACVPLINVLWALLETAFPSFWQALRGGFRAVGTIGNPIFLGSYLLLSAFLALAAAFEAKTRRARFIFLGVALLEILGVFLTGTRGAILGLGVGAVVFASVFVALEWRRHARALAWTLAAGVLVMMFVLAGSRLAPAFSRAIDLSVSDTTVSQRVLLFKITLRGIRARPLLGWGPENFDYLFDQNFDPQFLKYSIRETWADRAHNIFFDLLATQGVLGVLAALCTLVAFLGAGVRAQKRRALPRGVGAALAGLLGAYLGQGAAAFDTLSTVLPLLVGAAYLSARTREPARGRAASPPVAIGLSTALAAALVILFAASSVRPAVASHRLLLARGFADPNAKLAAGRAAFAIAQPYRDDFRLRYGNMVFAADAVTSELAAHAESELRAAISEHPEDYALRFTLANIVLSDALDRNASRYADAEWLLLEAAAYSPRRQSTYLQLGNQKLIQEDPAAALRYFEMARDLDPTVGEPWWHVGRGYASADRAQDAHAAFEESRRLGFISNLPGELNVALGSYEAVGDYRGMLELFIHLFGAERPGANHYGGLAEILARVGDDACARRAVAKVVALDPTAESDAMLFLGSLDRGEYRSASSMSAYPLITCDEFFR